MYKKTNVNSKCSMRVIKGCTGTTTWGQSAPQELAPASPWNQATQSFLTPLERPAEDKTKKLWSCHLTEGPESWQGGCHHLHPSSETHGGEDGTEAQLCLSQAHRLLLWEAKLWNAHRWSKVRRCSNETWELSGPRVMRLCSQSRWPSWLSASNRPRCVGWSWGQHMIMSTKVLGWELRRAHIDLIWERMSKICNVLIQLNPISTAGWGNEAGVMNGYFCIQWPSNTCMYHFVTHKSAIMWNQRHYGEKRK